MNRAKVDANVDSGVSSEDGGNPIASAIGTQLPQETSLAGTIRTDDTVSSSGVVAGGTKATAAYYFRTPKNDVVLSPTSVVGSALITVPVDITIDTQVKALAGEYQKYRFRDLTVSLVNNSPFGTASGSIVVGHLPDPSNALPVDATKALLLATRLSGSRVITPRNSVEIKPTLGMEFKWCRPAGTPRIESFGKLFVLVRQACAKDSVAQWNITLSGTVEFAESTINTTTTVTRSVHPATAVDLNSPSIVFFDGDQEIFVGFPTSTINNNGILVSKTPIFGTFTLTDKNGDKENFSLNLTQMDILTVKGAKTAVLITDIRDKTTLDIESMTVDDLNVDTPVGYSLFVKTDVTPVQPSRFFNFEPDHLLPVTDHPITRDRNAKCVMNPPRLRI